MDIDIFFIRLRRSDNEKIRKKLLWLFFVFFVVSYLIHIENFWVSNWAHFISMICGLILFPYIILRLLFENKNVAFFAVGFFVLLHIAVGGINADDHHRSVLAKRAFACYGVVDGFSTHRGVKVYVRFGEREVSVYYHEGTPSIAKGDTVIMKYSDVESTSFVIYNTKPDHNTIKKYQHPVLFVNNEESGNDYYYYAKLRPELALKNFGLNKLTLDKGNLLHYKNINDSIDSQVHQCADSLQNQLNRDIVDLSDAFYFHGEIIPAEQVFAEIPLAREYYERYCGKLK